jgi:hypothetical protein
MDLLAIIEERSSRSDIVNKDIASWFVLLLVLELKSLLRQLNTLRKIAK